MNAIKIVAIDPSGNFEEGKGTTGYIIFEAHADGTYTFLNKGSLKAEDFPTRAVYHREHAKLLSGIHLAIIEDFRLYNHKGTKAGVQSYSLMETPRLLGVLEQMCFKRDIPIAWQMASEVMTAFSEDVLIARGELFKVGNRYRLRSGENVNGHERSAYKHFLKWHYKNYRSDK